MIRAHIEEQDYGNELAVWLLDERDRERWVARVGDGGRLAWEPQGADQEVPAPTLRINRRLVGAFFAALEGYRDRNETAESVLRDALADSREVRDRLLALVEGAR